MDKQEYIDEIRFRLTGGVLELELDDSALSATVDYCLRELQRYIDVTKLKTVPFERCIDTSEMSASSVVRVFRAEPLTSSGNSLTGFTVTDPMYATQWQMTSGVGSLYNMNDAVYNYLSYNTLLQMRNTTSTDLAFRYDKSSEKLYINISSNTPTSVTIEYIPQYLTVEELVSDYWIDVLLRMSVATAKITLGRIRSRYTQSGALWSQDGDTMLSEGTAELNDIREKLLASTQLVYPLD